MLAFAMGPACGDTGRTGRGLGWPLLFGWPVLTVGGLAIAILCDIYQRTGESLGQGLIPTDVTLAVGLVGLVVEFYWSLITVEWYCAGDPATKYVQWLTAISIFGVVALILG